MASITKSQVEVVGFWGKPNQTPEIRMSPKASATTYIKGAPLVFTSGLVVAAAADANDLLGIAAEAGVNGSTVAKYYPLVPGLLLEFTMLEGSAADHVAVVTDRGVAIGFQISTNMYLDTSETTNGLFMVVAIPGTDYGATWKGIVGDTNVRVLAVPLNATTRF